MREGGWEGGREAVGVWKHTQDMERKMRRCDWRAHLFKRMKVNHESAGG